ncbi:AsmA-like C-terminal region-containing protein [Fulvivirga lutea]|uniref:AsmA-like C-terminal domain-containing protein n=1 Tax=Fulvivirga lutea TaxID=2810512 RepID=A0A974WG93_9BACT|nr:AsmA-like C-terminal region-containing protein [Fulvivirga lutea]QSE97949.1 hypothetical protein JR347_02375 [Fulvivirga lutea]
MSDKKLLDAEKLSFTLDPIQIINNHYVVEGIWIKNTSCNIEINSKGEVNYSVLKKSENTNSSFKIELSYVHLSNVNFSYLNEQSQNEVLLKTDEMKATIIAENNLYDISAEGNLNIDHITINRTDYLNGKLVNVNSKLLYDDSQKSLEISPSNLTIQNSEFETYGNYQFKDNRNLKLFLEAKNTDIKSIANLLPEKASKQLAQYHSNGNAYFDLSLIGDLNSKSGPELTIHFGLTDAQIDYEAKNVSITNTNLEGFYSQPKLYDNKTALLELKNVDGNLDGRQFKSNVIIKDLNDIHLNLDFDGSLATPELFDFLKIKGVSSSSGLLDVDIHFDGKLSDLKSKELTKRVKTNGQIELNDITLDSGLFKYPVNKLTGLLLINQNDIAINNLSGLYGGSDFKLNGYFRNIMAYLLLPNEPIGIEATFLSHQLDLNELLANKDNSASNYTFKLSPKLRLNLNCKVDELNFRRLEAKDINGSVLIKDQMLSTDNISLKALGGNITLAGLINTQSQNQITIDSEIGLKNVAIDSAFYVFENFNQNFLEERHLKGLVDAQISASLALDTLLSLDSKSLVSKITTTIKGGELNNFDPLQKLEKYVDAEKLNHLTFSDISTEVLIKDETVYLPEIEVNSNISSFKISGTHTFDQHINYKVVTPLRRKEKHDKDEAFGAIEETNTGRTLLHLKITGTTSNYEVGYDKEAVKNKIVSDLKKEFEELKEAFKNKGLKEKKKVELEEDDYFDWEENNN